MTQILMRWELEDTRGKAHWWVELRTEGDKFFWLSRISGGQFYASGISQAIRNIQERVDCREFQPASRHGFMQRSI